jgi:hypothetical protein
MTAGINSFDYTAICGKLSVRLIWNQRAKGTGGRPDPANSANFLHYPGKSQSTINPSHRNTTMGTESCNAPDRLGIMDAVPPGTEIIKSISRREK